MLAQGTVVVKDTTKDTNEGIVEHTSATVQSIVCECREWRGARLSGTQRGAQCAARRGEPCCAVDACTAGPNHTTYTVYASSADAFDSSDR